MKKLALLFSIIVLASGICFAYVIASGGATSTGSGFSLNAPVSEPSAANQRRATFTFEGGSWNMPQNLALGNYSDTSIPLSTDSTVTPDAAPTGAMRINVSTSTNFKGKLEGDPTTGVMRVTDAQPAGVYIVTVTAFDSGALTTTKTFTLTVTTPATCSSVTFAAATNFAAGSQPVAVAVGDFNGDGKQDFAVANQAFTNNVSILLGNGLGGFAPATNFAVGSQPTSVAVGDFNGDGKQDLAVANFEGNVSILLGNGSGSFSAPANFDVGFAAVALAVGDFNGDGKQDLVTANRGGGNSVSVFLGDGAGGFGAAGTFSIGVNPTAVVVGDFNGDDKQDLAATSAGEDGDASVSILLGDGAGSFSAAPNSPFTIGQFPVSLAVGDFNGDGKQDLATANSNSNDVAVLLGDGAGGFGAATSFATDFAPQSVAVGDFNSDGKQDLAVANGNSDNVSVLLGDGLGSFGTAINFIVGSVPISVVVGDFNGDGLQDLAVANGNAANVSVLLRQCAPPTNHPPTARCKDVTLPANGSCQTSITTAIVDNGSFDPDAGDAIASRMLNASGPFGFGPHTVTLTVTDTHGATNSCVATVTVTDTTKPTIASLANITVSATSPGGAAVTYSAPAASDTCGAPVVSCSVASGSTFPIGDKTVTCRATDVATNFAESTFNVHVKGAAEQVADLMALIDTFNLRKGVDKKFDHKLNEVLQALNMGNSSDACKKLADLIQNAQNESGKKLTAIEAKQIIAAANRIRITIGCLYGFVDMHTHPASQLGFGEQLFFGGNDGDPNVALGSCNCSHNFVVPPFAGSCLLQNLYRHQMVEGIDPHANFRGWPDFIEWPRYNSLLHQQMWIDWIKSAKEGGLRVMVALAVNSHTIADAAETTGVNDDYASMNKQLNAMRALFSRHTDFAEIAYTSADLRRIVTAGKLAVILGIEMDNIGNFYNPADKKGASYNPNPSEAQIKSEIDRIFNLGVRYIFPIHITNNVFGGTALYESAFNVANKYNTGNTFVPEVVSSSGGIEFKLQSPFQAIRQTFFGGIFMGLTGPILPPSIMPDVPSNYPTYVPLPLLGQGSRNSLGLTAKGEIAIRYMMQKGMLIDIDHMSEKSANAALDMAASYDYPVNSGHNDFRGPGPKAHGIGAANENARTDDQVRKIYALGGMVGLGHGGGSTNYVNHYRYGLSLTDGQPLAIGTDVNGFFALPGPPKVGETISPSFPKSVTGVRVWSFNLDGMAHYGLFPAFIESMKVVGMTTGEQAAFFSSAERFAQMWEKCDTSKTNVH